MRTMALAAAFFVVNATAQAQYGELTGLKILKPDDTEHVKSTPAPEGATILFDGKSLDKWTKQDRKSEAHWKLVDGNAMQVEKGGNIFSKEMISGPVKLHLEFRVPYEPNNKGQARGNSGVYVQGRYEVQVLDSYGLDSKNNDCGGIYEVAAPLKNVCKAPTIWQSYDIEFYPPKFENKKKTEPARMTVYQNGVKIHDNVKIPVDNTRAGMGGDPEAPGPIMLQDHGNPVQYRNIWMVPIKP